MIDLENVLDMSIYTDEGKESIQRLALSLQTVSNVLSNEEFEHMLYLVSTGHLHEFIDIGKAIVEEGKE